MNSLGENQLVTHQQNWVRETRFGRWFLSTEVWRRYVLAQAIVDLNRMVGGEHPTPHRMLDAGCGIGLAFPLLEQHFQPRSILGVDIDRELIDIARASARQCRCQVDLQSTRVADLSLPDEDFDMIFCHQLLHHTMDQVETLRHIQRLLTPGGVLMIGESCRSFIRSFPVRLLFRHPIMVQKTATEYVDLVKSVGFEVLDGDVESSTPWWSRRDLGLLNKFAVAQRDASQATEVLIVARKPAARTLPLDR
jgi:2-polyprenyl-3-methyl-5-hydroxy-6-metoxy-1,4-benzoquinol methylase